MAKVEVVGVVLAAGDGVRMGGSKALLTVTGASGKPLVVAHATRLREGGCARVIAVVRPSVIESIGIVSEVRLAVSRADDQAGSLAVALQEQKVLPDVIVVVTPVDAAPAGQGTLERLVAEVEKGALAATPRYEGRSGHPIACRRSVLDAYLGPPPYPPLRDVLHGLGDKRVKVEVSDPRVTVDLDTPEDVVALTGEAPRFVSKADGS